jgi:hypothetical protein
MKMLKTMLAGGAAVAALGLAAPAAAQWGNPYAHHNPWGHTQQWGHHHQQAHMSQVAAQRCSAAVQHRLSQNVGLGTILAQVVGMPTAQPRVLNVTQVQPLRTTMRVQGLATSGRTAHNPWGAGAWGSVGMAYQPDLWFRCDVDYRGQIRNVRINRR